ncbi:MAG: excinuclease ABC subunit UvrB [Bacteroidetes bacterium]|nr:excinuclease ABC subunit UvrB [Bacteroidota bacterium]
MDFQLTSDFYPTGDQPEAIKQLVQGLKDEVPFQTLLGVTGSGKTFTVANVIQQIQKPTLILSHNKTLAAQLFGEFKQFFPKNAVEYFVSYYDYYQPEAFLPATNTFIEKDMAINDEIEKFRLSASSALLSGRRDVIVISSVSCIYGIGNPAEFHKNIVEVKQGQKVSRNKLLLQLVNSLYSRTEVEFQRGQFRVKGDTVDVNLAYADYSVRILFFGDEVEEIQTFETSTGRMMEKFDSYIIYPANIFVTSPDTINKAIANIQIDLGKHVDYYNEIGKPLEAKRIYDRVTHDVEMMKELGYCSGIENYSRYFDGRKPGTRPFCLLDYFPKDYLMVIDESHATIPQIHAMYGGDRSRKEILVEYGFRLPAAMDNRPLKFEEFEAMLNKAIFVSATPSDFELKKSEGIVVEQLIRPTGLLDPMIEVRPTLNQIDDLLEEIRIVSARDERVLVTTLTKRMAEELAKFLANAGVRCRYIHSDIDTMERVEILRDLRLGLFDVLVGINLLREGLDLPEVSLVAILDADKEGFLRSERSLVQVVGRAARNVNGKVIMYGDKITDSMKKTMEETTRRRKKQIEYNYKHGITPKTIIKGTATSPLSQGKASGGTVKYAYIEQETIDYAADPVVQYMSKEQIEKSIAQLRKEISRAAKEMDFMEAGRLRDELFVMEKKLEKK